MSNAALPFPNGWYVIAASSELKKEAVLVKKLAGEELVLFRTKSGKVCVVEPFCPHLGAHLGHGGKVEGETIRCPFHGFCFDTEGSCTKTAYGSTPPGRAKLVTKPIHEINGLILVYYHAAGEAPDWFVPAFDQSGWTPVRWVNWEVKSHPQETTENSVDVGHFSVIHGFTGVETLQPATMNGPYLTARYAIGRSIFLSKLLPPIRSEFQVHVHGLGYSLVEVEVKKLGMRVRTFVFSTPVESEKVVLRLGLSYRTIKLFKWPLPLFNSLLSRILFKSFTSDVAHDLAIWENKKYVPRPMLAPGDGPIAQYRIWAKQFYSTSLPASAPTFAINVQQLV